ncbi:hypothetical protein D9757_001449 [Collybiopsis confluens]|uniref:Deacetylase sirtuin-type domain-containing protein n=1 Tax=Collybiopsis confluens TaxID=2823264 RepID=A0A8H5HZH6_9AGAR|nr:hypothetical protein D9757_001449 [Collybiopsis confluens]
MTLFLPLEDSPPVSSIPSFVIRPSQAYRAGISVKAGIPDFRSSEGLFQTLKRDNPKDALSSGKDLFDASVFNTEHKTALFCQMISRLSDLSKAAEPTPFHHLLRFLDEHSRLLRVYTQNIDAIEEKSGLSFGVPEFEGKRGKPRNTTFQDIGDPGPSTAANRTPRCIPLHGTLQQVHCQICTQSFPLDRYLPALASGVPPECPECTSMERTRQLVGKRPRGVGKLRPSVVLYNEAHKDGEGVGEIVQKDLIGSKGRSGADLLLVVGTSLRVPGTKRMVREFSKAVHSRGSSSKESSPGDEQGQQQQQQQPMKVIYLNLDFPVPTREWEGVFDAWIQGDAQMFAQMLQEDLVREVHAKEVALEKKKKKEEEIALAALFGTPLPKHKSKAKAADSPTKKRKVGDVSDVPRKKTMVVELPTLSPSAVHAYDDISVIGPPSPVTPSSLKLRIPAPARSYTIPGTLQVRLPTITLPPRTPVKKSIPSTIGQPPPTPEYTPATGTRRIIRSPPLVHPLSSMSPLRFHQRSSLSNSDMQMRSVPSESSGMLFLSSEEEENEDEIESDSDTEAMQVDNDDDDDDDDEKEIDRSKKHLHVHPHPPPQRHSHSQIPSSSPSLSWRDRERSAGKMILIPADGQRYHHHLSLTMSRSSGMYMLPIGSDGDGDSGMIVDVNLNNFRDRLGTSCLRTTQVEVGEGG